MSELATLYKSKFTTPADAVGRIASGVTLSMGMAVTEPPALLKALGDRAAAGKVDDPETRKLGQLPAVSLSQSRCSTMCPQTL